MNEIQLQDFAPEFQQATAELINSCLGARFGFRDDSKNPDLYDIARHYADHAFVIALLDREVVGTGGLIYESGRAARLVRMHTAELHRRKGVASSILGELERRALSCGVETASLETNVDWHDAHGFYLAAGYREVRRTSLGVWFSKRLGGGSVA